MVRYIWHDSRVPIFARIFVVLAPLYWLNPFDLIPDLQPGGHCDDIAIFCLLVLMACRLVPQAVFRDSRKAAALGMLYVTVTSSVPCQAHIMQYLKTTPTYRSGTHHFIDHSRALIKESSALIKANAHAQERQHLALNHFSSNHYHHILIVSTPDVIVFGRGSPSGIHSPPLLLTTRAGQSQLYALKNASATVMADKSEYSIEMLLHRAGGIFVGDNSC